jgi:NitT/TauT family transport system substrate-binding protein
MRARVVLSSFAPLLLSGLLAIPAAHAAGAPYVIRMSVDEDPIVPHLAETLGYFRQEGVEIVPVKVEDFSKEDYLLQAPLIKGQIDIAYHWFNHVVFGARHGLPIKAVMVINDAPGMTVMVANRVKDQIKTAADFKGRKVAEGAGYGTKSVITNSLTTKAGLPLHSFTPVMVESSGRQEAVLQGLKEGSVDVMTFQEPITSALLKTNLVTVLYDLNTKEGATRALGATYPAQSILASPQFLSTHPDAVQHLINALVRTMRFINTHSTEDVIARLPPNYFDGKDRDAELAEMRATMQTFAKNDYAFSPASIRVVVDSIQKFDFDKSEEGQWRATGDNQKVVEAQLYDNRFVERAMHEIK